MNAPKLALQLPAVDSTMWEIPFEYPMSVAASDIDGFQLRVLTMSDDNEIRILSNDEPIFDVSELGLLCGTYYKVQMAFQFKNKEIGEWSDAAIIKYTNEITISISGLALDNFDRFVSTHTGVYSNSDITEKQTEYRFEIYKSGELIETSGWVLHQQDQNDIWQSLTAPERGVIYEIRYGIKTINLITKWTELYTLVDFGTINAPNGAKLAVSYCPEDGCYNIGFKSRPAEGVYVIFRQSDEDNWTTRQEICKVAISGASPSSAGPLLFKDRATAHGHRYKYSVAQINQHGIYSNLIDEEQTEKAEFEDMYLLDADRQLRIRFNPKVSSFKNTILETKADTIGGTHPIFYRNGRTKYKEFPISGLISLLADEHEMFVSGSWEDMTMRRLSTAANQEKEALRGSFKNERIQLTGENIDNERDFKLQVLEWITDGQPKLFRSPTEGNYIVRLMNTSLAPNDTLGRMLHTFTSTAYEIDEYNLSNLIKYGFICPSELDLRQNYQSGVLNEGKFTIEQLMTDYGPITSLVAKGAGSLKYNNKSIPLGRMGIYNFSQTEIDNLKVLDIGENTTVAYSYLPPVATIRNFDNITQLRYQWGLNFGNGMDWSRKDDVMQIYYINLRNEGEVEAIAKITYENPIEIQEIVLTPGQSKIVTFSPEKPDRVRSVNGANYNISYIQLKTTKEG